MEKELVLSVCNFMVPELSVVLNEGEFPDVKLVSFVANCITNHNRTSELLEMKSITDKPNTDYFFIGSACNSPRSLNSKLPDNVREIYLEQCFELFINRETVLHFINDGYYIVTNGWLQGYKQNILNWGFEKDMAKVFFRESMKKILFLDTKIPGDYLPGLKAISEYMGLPYEVLPVGLSHCKGFVEALVNGWRAENERRSLNQKIAEVSKQRADYSVIFHQLETLVDQMDESRIVQIGFELMHILFAPVKIRFVRHFNGQIEISESNSYHLVQSDNGAISFEIKVEHANQLLGMFEVFEIQFPEYLDQYKIMGMVISQIFGLSISNARKYKTILEQSDQLKASGLQLQKINQSKDKFFSIIAHDLKGPFNTLIGVSELLLEDIRDGSLESVKNLSGIINHTSIQAYNLLINLLEWSRSQTGVIEFMPEQFQFVDLVEEVLDLLKIQADGKMIALSHSIPADLQVFGDVNMITTVVRNLVSNAIKYTRGGGSISVSAFDETEQVKISVQDTGIGIPSKNLNKLFKIEGNLSTSGTDNETGTGLGLILCKEFVEKHKGHIKAESKLGKGSAFSFVLPHA